MTTIHLIRHGQASFGSDNYDQLSELGERQCQLLGQWWRDCDLPAHRIVLGGMHRHRQSAEAFCAGYGNPDLAQPAGWQFEPALDEFDHEQILKLAHPELADPVQLAQLLSSSQNPRATFQALFSAGLARWTSGAHDADYRESWPAFKFRIAALLARWVQVVQRQDRQHTLVFTSGGPISAVCQQVLSTPDSETLNLLTVLMNSGVSKMVVRDGRLQLVGLNSAAHLDSVADRSLISYR
jgi:broad specificity phosphatase PhoE